MLKSKTSTSINLQIIRNLILNQHYFLIIHDCYLEKLNLKSKKEYVLLHIFCKYNFKFLSQNTFSKLRLIFCLNALAY